MKRGKKKLHVLALVVLAFFLPGLAVSAQAAQDETEAAVAEMGIEALMDIEVTSVSRKAQKLSATAAAIYVVTNEDIRRSGATSIPEALRLVPGLEVARIDGNKWAVTARGFNGQYSNKLLVLIDGRSVYTPLFAGVYWDEKDLMLEDVARIEVIRGPGATLWGANAVNGVINIISKHTKATQGTLATGGAGTEERGFGAIRSGGRLGDDAYFRVYAKYFTRDESVFSSGDEADDDWNQLRGGFRMDWQASAQNSLVLTADIYDGKAGMTDLAGTADEDAISGGHALFRWEHEGAESSASAFQFYYDRTNRTSSFASESRNTFDVDFQHRFALLEAHEIIWGLGYRLTEDDVRGSAGLSILPANRSDNLFSAFIQDEIEMSRDVLRLTVGSKVEHNDYTGYEVQPNARLIWLPDEQSSLWAAASRAVRTPARADEDIYLVLNPFPLVTLSGNPDMEPEKVIAYELGYRNQLSDRLSLDIATFYNVYDDLRTIEPTSPVTLEFDNKMDGETYGAELAARWSVLDRWTLSASYSYLQMQLRPDATSADTDSEGAEDISPHNQVKLQSYVSLPHNWEFDTMLYYVDDLPGQNVPDYIRLDARIGWRPSDTLDVSVVFQNLLDDQHQEFGSTELWVKTAEVERSVYGKVTLKF